MYLQSRVRTASESRPYGKIVLWLRINSVLGQGGNTSISIRRIFFDSVEAAS